MVPYVIEYHVAIKHHAVELLKWKLLNTLLSEKGMLQHSSGQFGTVSFKW